MSAAATAADHTIHPDSHRASPAVPNLAGRLLFLVRKLIDYGKNLASMLQLSES